MTNTPTINQSNQPLSFTSWIQYNKLTAISQQIAVIEYNNYVRNYYSTQNNKAQSDHQEIVNLYQNLLSEVVLNYSTANEKRFLTNLDLTNPLDLDIVIPYFATKLKQISQYFVSKREDVKQAKIKYNFYGSNLGLEKNIVNLLYQLLTNKDFKNQFDPTVVFPVLSTVIDCCKTGVSIQELYDTSTYFDQASGNNIIEPLNTIALEQAIINTLATYPLSLEVIVLSSTPSVQLLTSDNQLLLIDIERSNIADLPFSEFVNANQNIDYLDLSIQPFLSNKFTGTPFYYLSTGTTTNNIISGSLFDPDNYYANLLNRYNPTQIFVEQNNLVTEAQLGSFFLPVNQGISCYVSFPVNSTLCLSSLSTNSVYIFPDPNIYNSGRGNSLIDNYSPFKIEEDISNLIVDNSNEQLSHNILPNKNYQRFYPYQSREETLKYTSAGISRSYDAIDFFAGSIDSIWSNSDLYPVIPLQTPPFNSRLQDLVITDDILFESKSDIFGNEFGLYKKIAPKRNYNPTIPTTNYSTTYENISVCRTFSTSNINLSANNLTLSDKYNTLGTVLVRTPQLPFVNTITNVLSNVFIKYQTNINLITDLLSAVKHFDISNNTIVFETNNYTVIEQYSYNFQDNIFSSILGTTIFLTLNTNELALISPYISNKHIIYGKINVSAPLSSTSTPLLYPVIYVFDQASGKSQEVFSFNQNLSSELIINTPLTQIGTPIFIYNKNKLSYSLLFFCYNATRSQFLIIYNFQPTLPTWTLNNVYIISPPEYIATLTN